MVSSGSEGTEPLWENILDKQGDTKIAQERVPKTPIHAVTEEAQKLKEVAEKPSQQWCGQQLTVENAHLRSGDPQIPKRSRSI